VVFQKVAYDAGMYPELNDMVLLIMCYSQLLLVNLFKCK
jgi:hypothetical protein